jgi:predicted DNA-binding transcriptional regulator AlpA
MHNERVIRAKEVVYMTGLSRSTIWRMEKEGKFPSRRAIGSRSIGWLESDIMNWIKGRSNA